MDEINNIFREGYGLFPESEKCRHIGRKACRQGEGWKSCVRRKDKRTLIVDRGKKSLELALKLIQQSPRVVFLTASKALSADEELMVKKLGVKILYESQLLEITGMIPP